MDWSLSIVLEKRGADVVPDYTQQHLFPGWGHGGGEEGKGWESALKETLLHLFPHSTLLSPINDFSLTQICDYLTLVSRVLRLNFSDVENGLEIQLLSAGSPSPSWN